MSKIVEWEVALKRFFVGARVTFKAWFPLVPTIVRIGNFYDLPDVRDSYDQCKHPIPDIPDGRRFLRRDWKDLETFLLWRYIPDGPRRQQFLRWVWTWNLPVCDIGMLDFVLTYYQTFILSELEMYNFEYCSQNLKSVSNVLSHRL